MAAFTEPQEIRWFFFVLFLQSLFVIHEQCAQYLTFNISVQHIFWKSREY